MSDGNLDLIVDVQTTRDVQPLSSVDFNAAMFVTDEQVFSERVRHYSRTADLLTDGFSSDSATYKALASFFSQSPKPNQIAVGRRDATVVTLSMLEADVANSTAYSVSIQGVTVTYTSSATATADAAAEIELILDGLQALAVADTNITDYVTPSSAGVAASTTLVLTEIAGMVVSYDAGKMTATPTLGTWAVDIAAIHQEYDLYYALMTYDHSVAGILSVAAVAEQDKKMYFFSADHVDTLAAVVGTPTADDIVGQLQALNYDRTAPYYSATSDATFLECAHVGDKITTVPGATTWDLSAVSGVAGDSLSRTNITNLEAKNCNYFTSFGGIDMVRQGTVASGEYIDVIRGSDSMATDIQKELVRTIASANKAGSKIPLTDNGVAILIAAAEGIIEKYVSTNFIKDYIQETDALGNVTVRRGYTVTAGLVADLPADQRASRQAPDLQVIAYLAGAVHTVAVKINLFV